MISRWSTAVVLCLGTSWAMAHDPGLSSSIWVLDGKQLRGAAVFAPEDFALLGLADGRSGGVDSLLRVSQAQQRLDWSHTELFVERGADANVQIDVRCALGVGEDLLLEISGLEALSWGHRHHVRVETGAGELLTEALLSVRNPSVSVSGLTSTDEAAVSAASPSQPPGAPTVGQFLWLGVEHILVGYDHLLYLLALLLTMPSLRRGVGVITSFSLAHSITLALAALDLVRVNASIVEPLIAASIVIVCLENLVRRDPRHRLLTTFAFGLVHGLGFASVLRELGIGASGNLMTTIVSFNTGVELGQVGIAAVALPVLGLWNRCPRRRAWLVRIGSLCIGVAGAAWLVERLVLV